jgi:hypothetical protein
VTKLTLDHLNISGPLPASIGALTALEEIYLYANELSGSIPTAWGTLTSLRVLDLSSNALNGSVPLEFAGLTNLEELILNGNRLVSFSSIVLGSMPRLKKLSASDNLLQGRLPFPSSGDSLSALEYVVLSNNLLQGSFDSNMSSLLPALRWLDFANNLLDGNLPSDLPPNLFIIDLSNNFALTGALPRNWSQLQHIRRLALVNTSLFRENSLEVHLPFATYVDLSFSHFLEKTQIPATKQVDFVQLGQPGILNTSGILFACPFPQLSIASESLLWIRGACEPDFKLLYILVGVTIALVASLTFGLHVMRARWPETMQSMEGTATMMFAFMLWLLVVSDNITDILFDFSIIQFIDSIPMTEEQCLDLNNIFQPALYVNLPVESYSRLVYTLSLLFSCRCPFIVFCDSANFSEYWSLLNARLTSDLLTRVVTPSQASDMLERVQSNFRSQCNLMDGCVFDSQECSWDGSFNPFPDFLRLVYLVWILCLIKEFLKFVAVLYVVVTDTAPEIIQQFCATSLFFPILAFRPNQFRNVVFHKYIAQTVLLEFVCEVLIEVIPQLCIGIYFTLFVTQVGVSDWQLFSMFLSGLSCTYYVGMAIWALAVMYCRSSPQKTALESGRSGKNISAPLELHDIVSSMKALPRAPK